MGRMDLFGLVGLVGLLVGRHVVGMTQIYLDDFFWSFGIEDG